MEKHVWSSHALDQRIMKDETEQLIERVPENVAVYDQSSDGYSTSSSLKQTSNNAFEWTGAMTDGDTNKGAKCTALCLYKHNQKRTLFPHAVTWQLYAHTKLLPDAVAHAVPSSASVQMDSRFKCTSLCWDWYESVKLCGFHAGHVLVSCKSHVTMKVVCYDVGHMLPCTM